MPQSAETQSWIWKRKGFEEVRIMFCFFFPDACSVQFSHSVVSNSLQPHGLQHTRIPCPSPTPRACSNSCLLSRWCLPAISFSVIPFSSCLQSCPARFSNESVLCIRWPKYWSFSFNISPSNEYSGLISFRMDWLDLLAVQESSPTPQFKSINSSALSFLHSPTLMSIHDHWKNHAAAAAKSLQLCPTLCGHSLD